MGSYPGNVYDGSWTDYVTPLSYVSLNQRDDELRAIEEALGTYLVPIPPTPPLEPIHLSDYLRVDTDTVAAEHLFLAHDQDDEHPSAVSIGYVSVDPPPAAAPARPLGTLHIRDTNLSGATPSEDADAIVVDSYGDSGISLLFDDVGVGSVFFGAGNNDDDGRIQFNADTAAFHLGTSNASGSFVLKAGSEQAAVTIDSNKDATLHGDVTFGEELHIGAATAANRPLRMLRNSPDDDAGASFKNTGTEAVHLDFGSNRTGTGQALARIYGRWDGNSVAQIAFMSGTVATNKDRGEITFYTSRTNSNPLERGRVGEDGGLFFKSVSSNPGVDTDYAAIYSKDASGVSHIYVEAGQDVTAIPPISEADGELVFRSQNTRTGRNVVIHVERFVRRVEELTGKSLLSKSDAA
jgi:hypothetical protein